MALRELREGLKRRGRGKLAVGLEEGLFTLYLTETQAEEASRRLRAAARRGSARFIVPTEAIPRRQRVPALTAVLLHSLQPCAETQELLLRQAAASYLIAQHLKAFPTLQVIRENVSSSTVKVLTELAVRKGYNLLKESVFNFLALKFHSNKLPDICEETERWERSNAPLWDTVWEEVKTVQAAECQTEADFLMGEMQEHLVVLWAERLYPLQEPCRWCRGWERAMARAILSSARLRPNHACGFVRGLFVYIGAVESDAPLAAALATETPPLPEGVERVWRALFEEASAELDLRHAARPTEDLSKEAVNVLFAIGELTTSMARSRSVAQPLHLAVRAVEILERDGGGSDDARDAMRRVTRYINRRKSGHGYDAEDDIVTYHIDQYQHFL